MTEQPHYDDYGSPEDARARDRLPAPAYARRIRHGGLLRCCVRTLAETASETELGDRLHCSYAHEDTPDHWMTVADDGWWEWDSHLGRTPE